MGENNVCIGQFSIHYWEFAGYRAPDEKMERPLSEYAVKDLRDAPVGKRQPVQVEIPEGLRSIGDRAFEFCFGLTGVSIPDTITSIGNGAFRYCTSLGHVCIPNSVTAIGDEAFSDCTALTGIHISDAVKTIGESAFARCTGLQEITLPNTLESIGNSAFFFCRSLVEVAVPGSVAVIGRFAFTSCTSLRDLTIADGVKRIRSWAFDGCTALKELTLPPNIKIGKRAFYGCTSLTRLRFLVSAKEIGNDAFGGCTALEEITLPEPLCTLGHVQRIFGDVNQMSWKWLCGDLKVSEPLAAVFAEDLRNRRSRTWGRIITAGDVGLQERFLALWDKVPLDFLDKRIEKAMRAKKYEFVTVLLQYKNDHYLHEQLPPEDSAS